MPIQPSLNPFGEDVRYIEFTPATQLSNFIYCYWQLRTVRPLNTPFIYRVVADGCIDILLELNSPDQNFITGLSTSYIEFPLDQQFNYLGIRFFPAALPQLFALDASELTNRFEQISHVIPKTAQYLERHLHAGLTQEQAKEVLDRYFLRVLAGIDLEVDGRFYEAMEIILQNRGNVSVEKDLDTGLSARQLRRLFQFYVGDTSKIFSKIVRFQNILYAKPSAESLRNNKLFYTLGYYDQSHFIKEFKTYFGKSPSKAFERKD